MNIYVGNLPYNVTKEELQEIFAEYGEVSNVNMIIDKYTEQSKGFAFVEMTRQADAEEAIKALNSSMMKDRKLKVNQARPKEERNRRPRKY
jgi:RNA recognition motif-containing protein